MPAIISDSKQQQALQQVSDGLKAVADINTMLDIAAKDNAGKGKHCLQFGLLQAKRCNEDNHNGTGHQDALHREALQSLWIIASIGDDIALEVRSRFIHHKNHLQLQRKKV